MKYYLPTEIWIIIYEYEGLYYELMKKVLYEINLIVYQSKCHNCILKNIDNGHVCSVHWESWQESVKYIKANPSSPTREKAQRQRYQILREKLLPQDGSYLVHFHQDLLRRRHFLLRALRHHLCPMDNKDSWRRKLIS